MIACGRTSPPHFAHQRLGRRQISKSGDPTDHAFARPGGHWLAAAAMEDLEAHLDKFVESIHTSVYAPGMKSGDVIAALQDDGWYQVATKGSHIQFKHPEKSGRVTVPHPKRDLPVGTLKSIEKQSGLKLR